MHERNDANEDIPESPAEYSRQLEARFASENKRYKALYDIDPSNRSNYDLVIDTSTTPLEEVVQQILTAYQTWLNS